MVRAQDRSPDDLVVRVARRIAAVRLTKGLTQEALARTMGIATKGLQRMESGGQNLTLRTIAELARALDVEPDALLSPPSLGPPPDAWASLVEAGVVVLAADATPPKVAVPIFSLAAAAGSLGQNQAVERLAWAVVPKLKRVSSDRRFLARVVGRSMEPLIPDGAWCLFRADVVGAIEGRVVLLQHRDQSDPETEGAYALKRLKSVEVDSDGVSVRLESINPQHPEYLVRLRALDELRPVAEFVRVVAPRVTASSRR